MTSGNHKKQRKNNKHDENVGKERKKPEENQSQKTDELIKENRKEESTSTVAEDPGTCEDAVSGTTTSEKVKQNDYENVTLGDQDEGGISINDDVMKGNEENLDGLEGGYVKPSTRVTFGNGMFVDLEVDSSELLKEGTKVEVASEAKAPETPDQEEITDGQDNQETGEEAEEDIDPDGKEGKTCEKGEGEEDQVEADGQAGQREVTVDGS